MDRRQFISILSGSALFSAGCKKPDEAIAPAVTPKEYSIPGVADYYSTGFAMGNVAYGAVIKAREGRPIKVDGNPAHPVNGTASNIFMQSSLYSLYDPKRISSPTINGKSCSSDDCIGVIKGRIKASIEKRQKVYILIPDHCSPSFDSILTKLCSASEYIKTVTIPSSPQGFEAEINNELLGINSELVPDISKADNVLTFDSDILGADKLSLWHQKKYGKRIAEPGFELIAIEPSLSLTGANATQRIALGYENYFRFACDILRHLLKERDKIEFGKILEILPTIRFSQAEQIAGKLNNKGLVIPGNGLDQETHAVILMINYLIGGNRADGSISYDKSLPFSYSKRSEINDFMEDIEKNEPGLVIFSGVFLNNYDGTLLEKIQNGIPKRKRISLSYYMNEFSKNSGVYMPTTHFCEEWNDAVSFDNTYTICQPIIKPLVKGAVSIPDIMVKIFDEIGDEDQKFDTFYNFLGSAWQKMFMDDNERMYAQSKGVFNIKLENIAQTIDNSITIAPDLVKLREIIRDYSAQKGEGIKAYIRLSHNNPDGIFYGNAWLSEIPNPISGLTWINAALINSLTAGKFNLTNRGLIEISKNGKSISIPVLIDDNVIDDSIILHFEGDEKSNPAGLFDVINNRLVIDNISVKKTGKRVKLPIKDNHLITSNNHKDRAKGSVYPKYEYKGHRWGMAIDLSKCIGCSSCVAACRAENNIPVVGPEEIIKGRDMQWIQIQRGKIEGKEVFLPLLCQHCNLAPCESVCPVSASSHSPEGLNETTYNRCVGARFCMANCPYKIRKFNYSDYHLVEKEPFGQIYNPDVTVRMRGIVEKCSFCVQRINEAKYKYKGLGMRIIPDGKLQTACQEACPTGAIVFGDMNDPKSKASRLMKSGKGFYLLEEFNTEPSIKYLKK